MFFCLKGFLLLLEILVWVLVDWVLVCCLVSWVVTIWCMSGTLGCWVKWLLGRVNCFFLSFDEVCRKTLGIICYFFFEGFLWCRV